MLLVVSNSCPSLVIANSVFEYFISCQCFVDSLPVFILLDLGFFYLKRVAEFSDLILQSLQHIIIFNSTAETNIIDATLAPTEAGISNVWLCPNIVRNPNVVKV